MWPNWTRAAGGPSPVFDVAVVVSVAVTVVVTVVVSVTVLVLPHPAATIATTRAMARPNTLRCTPSSVCRESANGRGPTAGGARTFPS
jgi:hypothetical protein